MPLLRELEILEPYGIGNPEPLFMTSDAEVCERKVFSAGMRYRLRQAGRVVSGVIFGAGETYPGMPGRADRRRLSAMRERMERHHQRGD